MAKLAEVENIEIVDQPEEFAEEGNAFPWFLVPVVVVLAALGAFFLIRLFMAKDEE